MVNRPNVLLATSNQGKIKEMAPVLAALGWQVKTLADVTGPFNPVEDGQTFTDNATIKAVAGLMVSGWPTIADDSGLEVDALFGAPGVHSARFGGEGLTDQERNRLLLAKLSDVPTTQRTARFRSVLALQRPGQAPVHWSGTVEGWIGPEPRGLGGFGYDPIFYLRDGRGQLLQQSIAELTPEQKNAMSHRGQALEQLRLVVTSGQLVL